MSVAEAGFREIEHTADWELEVWASDLPSLLEQAAKGMYALSGTRLKNGPRIVHALRLSQREPEQLLVAFLNELLYLGEQEGLGFEDFQIHLDDGGIHAELIGAPILSQDKEIKAVTYHKMSIRHTPHGLETNIVFDI